MIIAKKLFSYLPVSLFGSVMGLSAISAAWQLVEDLSVSSYFSAIFACLAMVVFVMLCVAYGLKIITSFQDVKEEFANPITRPFFATFAISLLLLPFCLHLWGFFQLAFYVWTCGVVLMLIFSAYIVSFWISYPHNISHITPAWIIPVVGILDIPLAIPILQIELLGIMELARISVAIGLFFTTPLLTLILARVVFFEKLPDKLMPTLVIFLAPFGAGVGAYLVAYNDHLLPLSLYFIGLFFFFALIPQILRVYLCCPFRVSWWAVSFPLAAMSVAGLKISKMVFMYESLLVTQIYRFTAIGFLCLTTLIIIWLTLRTLQGIFKGELKSLA